jgi:hypothetical protein
MRQKKVAPAKRNPIARDLATPKYRARTVAPKRGAGSYRRNRRPDIRGGDCHFGALAGGDRGTAAGIARPSPTCRRWSSRFCGNAATIRF